MTSVKNHDSALAGGRVGSSCLRYLAFIAVAVLTVILTSEAQAQQPERFTAGPVRFDYPEICPAKIGLSVSVPQDNTSPTGAILATQLVAELTK